MELRITRDEYYGNSGRPLVCSNCGKECHEMHRMTVVTDNYYDIRYAFPIYDACNAKCARQSTLKDIAEGGIQNLR